MSDPMKGTPLAAVEPPEGVVGFGAGEVAYLLARHETPSSQRSREVLSMDPKLAGDGVLLAGASSLVARGLLVTDGDSPGETKSVAALLDYAAGNAYRWTRLGLVDAAKQELDYVVLLESDTVVALLQPRIYASWFVRFGEPDTDRQALVTGLIQERVAGQDGIGALLQVITADSHRNLAVRSSGTGWEALADVSGPGTGTGGVVDTAGLGAMVAALYPGVLAGA